MSDVKFQSLSPEFASMLSSNVSVDVHPSISTKDYGICMETCNSIPYAYQIPVEGLDACAKNKVLLANAIAGELWRIMHCRCIKACGGDPYPAPCDDTWDAEGIVKVLVDSVVETCGWDAWNCAIFAYGQGWHHAEYHDYSWIDPWKVYTFITSCGGLIEGNPWGMHIGTPYTKRGIFLGELDKEHYENVDNPNNPFD